MAAMDDGRSDTTHAWTEIYLPGVGWIAYDPTNGTVGDVRLIRIAVARDIRDLAPISGSFKGAADDYIGMDVAVAIRDGRGHSDCCTGAMAPQFWVA